MEGSAGGGSVSDAQSTRVLGVSEEMLAWCSNQRFEIECFDTEADGSLQDLKVGMLIHSEINGESMDQPVTSIEFLENGRARIFLGTAVAA